MAEMTRPPDGGDGPSDEDEGPTPDDETPARDRDKPFDEVWKQLPTDAEASGKGSTKLWDDDARKGNLDAKDDPPEADDEDGSATARTKLGHPGVAGVKPPPAVAAAEMDKLMRGAMPTVPSDQSGIRPRVLVEEEERARAASHDDLPRIRIVPAATDDDEDEAKDEANDDAKDEAKDEANDDAKNETKDDAKASSSARRRAVAVRPEPAAASADTEGLSTRGKLLIGTIGAAVIVGLGWAMAASSVPTNDKPSIEAPPAAPIPPTGGPRRPPPEPPPEPTPPPEPDGGSDSSGGGEAAPEPPRTGDPRQPPTGSRSARPTKTRTAPARPTTSRSPRAIASASASVWCTSGRRKRSSSSGKRRAARRGGAR